MSNKLIEPLFMEYLSMSESDSINYEEILEIFNLSIFSIESMIERLCSENKLYVDFIDGTFTLA